jgi:hypothetical protein
VNFVRKIYDGGEKFDVDLACISRLNKSVSFLHSSASFRSNSCSFPIISNSLLSDNNSGSTASFVLSPTNENPFSFSSAGVLPNALSSCENELMSADDVSRHYFTILNDLVSVLKNDLKPTDNIPRQLIFLYQNFHKGKPTPTKSIAIDFFPIFY